MRGIFFDSWRRLGGDERGTALTEFAITLPVFIMVLTFVYHMGIAGHVLTEEAASTHRNLWDEVLPMTGTDHLPPTQDDSGQPHVHPVSGAAEDDGFLDEHDVPKQRQQVWAQVEPHERGTHQNLSGDGHWGESHRRTRSAAGKMDFADVTANPDDVLEGSSYGRSLVADGDPESEINMSASTGGGPGGLNSMGHSVAPALGAGIRYGVIHHIQEGELEFPHGWTLPVRSTLDVLAPPTPVATEEQSARVTRRQLENHQPYRDLLGIAMDQPL